MSALHALLVGVDLHRPERFPDGRPIPPLSGAVDDAVRVGSFLESDPFAVPRERIRWLLSPHPWVASAPAADGLPTRRNLVREIRGLGDRAVSGDQVLIHFSGHGARLPTAVPRIKGVTGLDECLVPSDAGAEEGRFLRDVELHALLRELASRGLLVTLIVDACHSGGVHRLGHSTHVRGLGDLPFAPPASSPLGSWDALAGSWPRPRPRPPDEPERPGWRRLEPDPGLLPMPERCVLLAACLPNELARESPSGGSYGGVLTRHLLRTLEEAGGPRTYREAHRRLRERIAARDPGQTPVLAGDGDRVVLGCERRPAAGRGEPDPFRIDPLRSLGRRAHPRGSRDRHRAIDRLTASPAGEGLGEAIEWHLFTLDRVEDWWDPRARRPVDPARVEVGILLCLLLRNRSSRALEVAVLDLRYDGGIVRIWPSRDDGESALLDSRSEQPVFFRSELPAGRDEGRDRIKLFVATGPIATDHLEQDACSEPGQGAESLRSDRSGAAAEDAEAWATRSLDLVLRRPVRPPAARGAG